MIEGSTLMSEDIENEEELTSQENVQEEAGEETETVNAAEEVTEEPQGKFYTDEEFNRAVNEIADRRVARKMRKMERELDKYKDTENVLKSQLGGENIEEINNNLRKLYTDSGVDLPERYVSEDRGYIEYQAERDSKDIIAEGYDVIKQEAGKYASVGYDNLSEKDKIIFNNLVDELNKEDDKKALRSLNIDTSILEDKNFIEYRQQFNNSVPVTKIYDMYSGNKEVKINTPGDLTNNSTSEKEYFTDEEIERMTDEEIERNWEKIRKSQTRNK